MIPFCLVSDSPFSPRAFPLRGHVVFYRADENIVLPRRESRIRLMRMRRL